MNKDEMASIADELSGTALVLNASNTMRDRRVQGSVR